MIISQGCAAGCHGFNGFNQFPSRIGCLLARCQTAGVSLAGPGLGQTRTVTVTVAERPDCQWAGPQGAWASGHSEPEPEASPCQLAAVIIASPCCPIIGPGPPESDSEQTPTVTEPRPGLSPLAG
jgi:hypothetical protein